MINVKKLIYDIYTAYDASIRIIVVTLKIIDKLGKFIQGLINTLVFFIRVFENIGWVIVRIINAVNIVLKGSLIVLYSVSVVINVIGICLKRIDEACMLTIITFNIFSQASQKLSSLYNPLLSISIVVVLFTQQLGNIYYSLSTSMNSYVYNIKQMYNFRKYIPVKFLKYK